MAVELSSPRTNRSTWQSTGRTNRAINRILNTTPTTPTTNGTDTAPNCSAQLAHHSQCALAPGAEIGHPRAKAGQHTPHESNGQYDQSANQCDEKAVLSLSRWTSVVIFETSLPRLGQ